VLLVFLLIKSSEPDTVGGREGDPRLLASSQGEDVANSGGEVMAVGISHVHDVERARVLLNVCDLADSARVVAADGVAGVADLDLGDIDDLAVDEVVLERVTDIDVRVGEADRASIVCDDVGDLAGADELLRDLKQFKAPFSLIDLLKVESALMVVQHSEALVSLFQREHIHYAEGEASVSAQSVVNLDGALLVVEDCLHLAVVESVLEFLLESNREWDALTTLVRALRRANSE